jgi:hypothetical protein
MSMLLFFRARNGPFLFPLMWVLGSYGLQRPHGSNPALTAASRLSKQTRLWAAICLTELQPGLWNLLVPEPM